MRCRRLLIQAVDKYPVYLMRDVILDPQSVPCSLLRGEHLDAETLDRPSRDGIEVSVRRT